MRWLDRDRCAYDAEDDSYVCPNGKLRVRTHDNVPMRQHVYRASRTARRACPFRAQCSPGRNSRTVTRSYDHALGCINS